MEVDDPWTPADLGDDLALWLDASDTTTITESDGAVSAWDDKSGNDRHATQESEPLKPQVDESGINGLDTLYFGDSFLQGDVFSPTAVSVFAVRKFNNPAGSQAEYANAILDTTPVLNFSQSDGIRFDNWRGDARFGTRSSFSSTSNTSTEWQIQAGLYEDGSRSLWLDSVSVATSTPSGDITTTATTYTIGRFQTNATGGVADRTTDGYVAEIIVCQASVAPEVREKIEGYLAHKWGLTANLPAEHPYKSSAPTK